jgi:hypothetical protein
MIRIEFEKKYGEIIFRDAITLPEDHEMTDEQIEAIKQERFDNWVAIITAPPPPGPTPEDVIDVVAEEVPQTPAE